MDRQTRKQLKTDKFAEEVGQTFNFFNQHRMEVIRYGAIALAVIVLGGAYYFYSRHQAGVREAALEQALKIDEAVIAPAPTPTNLAFPTKEDKEKARTKAFSDLMTNYHGTSEGAIGGIYTAAAAADQGKVDVAIKIYQDIMDSAPKDEASLAAVALAHLYASQGKVPDAQKLLQNLIDHPTDLVSSESAKLELAEILAPTNRQEALKLVTPLETARTAISKVAIAEAARINETPAKQ